MTTSAPAPAPKMSVSCRAATRAAGSDGVQVIVHKGHAYIGHMFSRRLFRRRRARSDAIRRRWPSSRRRRTPARIICKSTATSCSPSTARISGRCRNMPARPTTMRSRWPTPYRPISRSPPACASSTFPSRQSPREIGFLTYRRLRRPPHLVGRRPLRLCLGAFRRLHRPHAGGHRCVGPDKAEAGRQWWLPGMNRAGGETPPASFGKRTALHHLITAGNIGYAAWRDGGFTIHDFSDPLESETAQPPQLLAALRRRRAHAAAAAGPQAAGAGRRSDLGELRQWPRLHLGDRRARAGEPGVDRHAADAGGRRFLRQGRQIRPAQSARKPAGLDGRSRTLIFATYHNAGLRIYDIRNAVRAEGSRLFRAAAAGEDRRSAAEPGAGDPVLRRLRRHRTA